MSSPALQGYPTEQLKNAMRAGLAVAQMPASAAIAPCSVSPIPEQDNPNRCKSNAG